MTELIAPGTLSASAISRTQIRVNWAVTPKTVVSAAGAGKTLYLWNGSSNDASPSGWTEVAFDDSAWGAPVAVTGGFTIPVGSTRVWPVNRGTSASPDERAILRHTFSLSAGEISSAHLSGFWDDSIVSVWVNGTLLPWTNAREEDLDTSLFVAGSNVVAFISKNQTTGWVFMAYKLTFA